MPKFIVIDWLDWAWKNTQTLLLKEKLESEGKKVLLLDYPRYSEPSGFWVAKYLRGGYKTKLSPEQASVLYTIDRLDDYLTIKDSWDTYDYVLANRYTSSNLIHQFARIWREIDESWKEIDEKELQSYFFWFKEFLYNLEHRDLELPMPDKIIVLDVSLETSLSNITGRWNEKDTHENQEHLKYAKKVVDLLFTVYPSSLCYIRINCEDINWKLRTREEILKDLTSMI